MAAKMVVDIKSDVLKSGRELKFTESTEVRFSCNEMPVDRLLAFFKIGLSGRANLKPAAEAKTVSEAATGTLDEVIKQIGFDAAAD